MVPIFLVHLLFIFLYTSEKRRKNRSKERNGNYIIIKGQHEKHHRICNHIRMVSCGILIHFLFCGYFIVFNSCQDTACSSYNWFQFLHVIRIHLDRNEQDQFYNDKLWSSWLNMSERQETRHGKKVCGISLVNYERVTEYLRIRSWWQLYKIFREMSNLGFTYSETCVTVVLWRENLDNRNRR